ncbi:hypothetical protein M9Y10_005050 [Tritrichomonas musculus]|uniref:Structural maintenance of chromosomes protein n=1 Tax=Tritrichomonas musculus TaxID=1915356 RepID=A0ABR2JK60_9EUKA
MEDTRLVITKMVLHNFKSFYGTKIISGFHPQFTSIIGPNGSGKSNLIDAMLFVFGYRAKQIRQSKLIGLIHNSALHHNVKESYVTINFARVDSQHELIPGTEFSIKRDVALNGDSNYYMNSTKVKRKEITDFLLREGVDFNNNRFLILQGEVRNISLMKPMATNQNQVGFLEYIEEIIGSNVFIPDIKAVEEELTAKNEEKDQIAERLNISKRDVESLTEARNEAQHYLDLQAKMKLVDAKRLHTHRGDLENTVLQIEGDVKKLQEQIDDQKKKIEDLEQEDKATQDQIKTKEKELNSVLKPKLEEARKILDAQENKQVKLTTEKEGAKKVLNECEKTKEESEKEIKTSDQVLKSKENEKEEKQKLIDEANVNLTDAKKELEDKTNEVKIEIEKLRDKLQEAKEEFASENEKFMKLESQMTQSEDEIKAINRKVTESKQMRLDKERALEEANSKIIEIEEKIPNKEQIIEENKKESKKYESFIKDKEGSLNKLQEEARQLAINVNEMKRTAAKNPARSRLINCILDFKNKTNNQNIYGRLRDLAKADDPKYEYPFEIASGNKLNYIVVQTVEDANLCIEHLRKEGAGYGNFIILKEQEKHRRAISELMRNPDPPDTELLLRKLNFDKSDKEKYMPAFYYVFRDTLVAEDLEIAKRVGLGKVRRRVVTMDGEIVDKSGLMTGGGGKQASKGGMSKINPEEIKEEEEKLNRRDTEIKRLRQEIEMAKNKYGQINIDELELEVKKLKVDLVQYNEQAAYIQDQLSKMTDCVQSQEDTDKINELQQFIDDHVDEMRNLRASVDSLRSKCQEYEKEISEIVDIRTKEQKEKKEKIEKIIDGLRREKAKVEAAIKAAERKISKYKKIIGENEDTQKKTQEDLEKIEKDLEQLKEKKDKQAEEVEQLENESSELDGEIKKLQEKDSQTKSSVNSLNLDLENKKTDLAKLNSDMKVVRKELTAIAAQFERMGIQEDDLGELENKSMEDLELQRAAIEKELNDMNPNLGVIKEYDEKKKIYDQHFQEFTEVSEKRNEIAERCTNLKQQRLEMFMNGFTKIALKLKETYQILTLGGDAELELVDSVDPFSQGINFSVRPPGKSWKLISNLSGGEQTLSSLSLVFSLHQFKPTPFYVMDEIDAALDYRNVSIIANYLKERTTNAQFIVVSLRNHMFELADRLVGIFKVNDCASAITIDIDEERKVHDDNNDKNNQEETDNQVQE